MPIYVLETNNPVRDYLWCKINDNLYMTNCKSTNTTTSDHGAMMMYLTRMLGPDGYNLSVVWEDELFKIR